MNTNFKRIKIFFKKFRNKNFVLIIPSILILSIPIIFSRNPYSRITPYLVEEVHKKFISREVQKLGYSITTKSFSRKDSAHLKLKLLSKIDNSKKDIILLANHQLQYITNELEDKGIFNMWMGNYGITEISDIVTYMDKYDNKLLPNKILITGVTTPNNDNGDCIIGYRDELPNYLVGISNNPYVIKKSQLIFTPGSVISNSAPIRKVRQTFDFKNLYGFLRTEIFGIKSLEDVSITDSKKVAGEFTFGKTGSSLGFEGPTDSPLKFNYQNFYSVPNINYSSIDEIVFTLAQIDEIALKRGINHVLLIPPVHESNEPYRMNSYVNKVFDKALAEFKSLSKATIIIDHRRDERFLGKNKSHYFIHFDHPSAEYGLKLFEDINTKLMSIN